MFQYCGKATNGTPALGLAFNAEIVAKLNYSSITNIDLSCLKFQYLANDGTFRYHTDGTDATVRGMVNADATTAPIPATTTLEGNDVNVIAIADKDFNGDVNVQACSIPPSFITKGTGALLNLPALERHRVPLHTQPPPHIYPPPYS